MVSFGMFIDQLKLGRGYFLLGVWGEEIVFVLKGFDSYLGLLMKQQVVSYYIEVN